MSRLIRRGAAGMAAAFLLSLTAAHTGGQTPPAPATQTPATSAAESRVTISGSVVDAALTPIAGATITLEPASGNPLRANSDATGAFQFRNVAPGTYRLRAERAGFTAMTRDLRVPAGRTTLQLPIVLSKPSDKVERYDAKDAENMRQAGGGLASAMPSPPPPSVPAPASTATGQSGAGGGGRGGGIMPRTMSGQAPAEMSWPDYRPRSSGERYAHVAPNRFHRTLDDPLSTFGADVDTASFTNVRRMLSTGQLPPSDAVRIEEFVNYFRFPFAAPASRQPIALTTEIGDCPWAPSHKLVLIGARARTTSTREIEGRNIVLLIDVSGSMAPVERLPLIKSALAMFADTLQPDDRLSIVTYAGTSGVALSSTPARQRDEIQRAIASLQAGGSTNGAQGLTLAYRIARENYIPGGVNRVILATDGDFNVGVTSQAGLFGLIEREKSSGVFLSVFGVGSGNLKDRTMEMLADKGNGNYAYLDTLQEARRVLVRESAATLETVAKDVKFQVEFNPAVVSAWKQIGYENRALAAEDFNDDRKDGGEMGAGQSVTVLYEIVPAGVAVEDGRADDRPSVDPLKYQSSTPVASDLRARPQTQPAASGEWMTVKARYQAPEGNRSDMVSVAVRSGGRTSYLPIAAAAAEFGLLLRDGSRDRERWDALERRVDRLSPPATLSADVRDLQELIAIAKSIARTR